MAAASVKELFESGASATVGADAAQTALPRQFRVTFASASYQNLYDACYATAGGVSIPAIGALYKVGSAFKVRTISPQWERGGEGRNVLVTVSYGLPASSGGGIVDPATAPWSRDTVIDITPEVEMVESYHDLGGIAVATTAGVPDENGLMIPRPLRRAMVSFAVQASGYTPATADVLAGTVNSAALTIAGRAVAKWCGRIERISHPLDVWVNPATLAETSYYRVVYEIMWIAANTNRLQTEGVILANGYGLSAGDDMGLRFEARPNKGLIQKKTVSSTAQFVPCYQREVEADGEYGECHWCNGLWEDAEYERDERGIHTFPAKIIKPAICHHKPDCLRQRALEVKL